jgi:hypothetical protein
MWRLMRPDIKTIADSPRKFHETRGSTALLVVSIFFPRLWLIDVTGMSLFWVVRPWYRTSIWGRPLVREHNSLWDGRATPSGKAIPREKWFFQNDRHRFFVGLLCGGIIIGIVWVASVWMTSAGGLTPSEATFYDHCLVAHDGNTVACDAVMRIYRRGY